MINAQNTKVACCISLATQPRNSGGKNKDQQRNSNATQSLKALALKALQRNNQRNTSATQDKNQRNFEGLKTPEKLHLYLLLKHGVVLEELRSFLGEDWILYKNNPKALICWADSCKDKILRHGFNNH